VSEFCDVLVVDYDTQGRIILWLNALAQQHAGETIADTIHEVTDHLAAQRRIPGAGPGAMELVGVVDGDRSEAVRAYGLDQLDYHVCEFAHLCAALLDQGRVATLEVTAI
jgi:hypothetical protein